ncbi:MAG: GAF domain-containing protein [Armatimonadetes bacterium]|nr:GAF domain-containing protein [Armatimonadota bacterium]MDW8028838.1 GAF domain-containing protein [Armatimonadota bacterium]
MTVLKKRNWKTIMATVLAIALVGALADWSVSHFAYRTWLRSIDLTVGQVARQCDEFFEFAARSITFQRTFNINEPLLDPKRRENFLHQSGFWLEEIRKSVGADLWVIANARGEPVVNIPLSLKPDLLRSTWEAPFKDYPCRVALFTSSKGEPAFIGVETDIVADGKKRGEIWLLYNFESLAQRLSIPQLPISLKLTTVKGKTIAQLSQFQFSEPVEPISLTAKLNGLPIFLVASVPKSALSEEWTMRLLVWDLLILGALLAAWFIRRYSQIYGNELAVKLTEIFNMLSERFLETGDTEKVFKALAEAIVGEFRFSLAIVFRFDEKTQNYISAGYAPYRLIRQILSVGDGSREQSNLILPSSVIGRLQSGRAYLEKGCFEAIVSAISENACQTLSSILQLRNEWCALLFAEGKPVGALIVGTSKAQFSDEELQALELVRQQAAMLLKMVLNWEEQREAEKRKSRFQETLLRLTKDLPNEQNLIAKLQLIAQEAMNVLEVSRLNIWQIASDGQHAICLVASGEDSQNLVGTVLPIGRYFAYLTSLEGERVIATSSVLDDPRTNELANDYWLPYGIEATMDSPVRVEGKMVGIVCCEHKSKRKWSGDEIAFAGDVADLVARAILESQHQRRERYLSTLSQFALQLLIATEWESVLPAFLEDMGKVAEADRAFAAQLLTNEQGQEILHCLSVWSADGTLSQERYYHLNEVAMPHQIEALKIGEPVFVVVKTLPEPYRQFYEGKGVKAILVVPIFVESRWWGVLGFSARRREYYWDDIDSAILRIAASLLGSIIERQRAIDRELDRERQFRDLLENANVGIYRSTPEGRLILANPALARMLGYESPEEAMAYITDLAQQVYSNPNQREDLKRMIGETGLVQNFIAQLKRRNGEIFWASISGRGVYAPDGKLLYYEGFVLDISARKKAEEQLQRKIEQLQALNRLSDAVQRSEDIKQIAIETINCLKTVFKCDKVAISLIDEDGNLKVKASDGISENLKRAIEEALARPEFRFASSLICSEDVELATDLGYMKQIFLEEGIKAIACSPISVQDKVLGRLSVYFSRPRKFERNEIQLLQTIAHQLSFVVAKKLAEEKLRRSEKEFRSIFENAVVGIYRSTPEGRFLMANETLARINGYESVEELMALDIPSQIYLNPEDREKFKRLMAEHGFVANYRYPIKRKDESIGWVAKWARAVKDSNGNILYYEGFVLDITEQVQIEQRLYALQDAARSLVMKLDIDSIVQIAINTISQLYSNSAVLIFRYREESDAFYLESGNENAKELMQVLRLEFGSSFKRRGFPILEDKIWSGDNILINDLNSSIGSSVRKLVQIGYRAIFARGIGDSSQLWGLIAICRKGSSFSEPDTIFLNSFCDYLSIAIRNANLFQQVQQSYEEMRAIQERMIEQERLRALGQIASGIAHDINNALVPVQGFAEILLEHNDPMVRDAAEMIFKSANDITAIIQRMREFYRTRSDDEVLEPVNLNELCKDALKMTKPKWFNMPMERGIVIEAKLELAEDLPPLMGISSEIRQAIVNLIINAVDAMPSGGNLTIRTYKHERSGRAWGIIEVSDTGIGMDEETKRRALEPFFTTKGDQGSGLGLAAVYGTVQRHEGFLEIDSELGKGTTIRLWFPSNVVQSVDLQSGEIPSLKLLVIDDEPSVRETIALLLRKDGHIVVTAANGEEGLIIFHNAYLQGNPFNVVITDLGMPRVDGLSVAQRVKEISPETPIILLTGWGFRIRTEEVQNVVDLVLTKPASHQQIRRALNQVWLSHSETKFERAIRISN